MRLTRSTGSRWATCGKNLAVKRLWAALLILLLAAALRAAALGVDQRFHPDEALFATFARGAAVQGDWLLRGPLDKTPLSIYAAALGMTFLGVTPLPNGVLTLEIHRGEFAARLPNVFASIICVALVIALARRAYGSGRAGLVAGMLAAMSPLALAFSAVAFTDTLMLLCITAALYVAVCGRAALAGICLALGIGCKQQALLYAPLLLAVLWCEGRSCRAVADREAAALRLWNPILLFSRQVVSFALPVAGGLLALAAWDAARGQATGLWALAAVNNDPGRLARLDELLPRFVAWLSCAQYLLPIGGLLGLVLLHLAGSGASRREWSASTMDGGQFAWILAVYAALYLLAHWLIAFNIYDRYLLPLLPIAVLLVAGAVRRAVIERKKHGSAIRQAARFAALALLFALSLPVALDALAGRLPIGGDRGRHQGIAELTAHLNSKPLGAIIYDHWLGWELGYYLGAWSDKRRVYYPTPHALAADAPLNPDRAPRYLVALNDVPHMAWLDALRDAGFTVSRDYARRRFVVYRLIPPQDARCASNAGSSWPGQIAVCGRSSG